MASPFVGFPVDLGAVQGSLCRQRVFQDRFDPLALPENILYDINRFSLEGIRYLIVLVGPYVGNATQRSCALTVAKKDSAPCYSQGCSCAQYIAKFVRGVS